ncbi:hypothetical protein OAH48_01215 [Methylophilaceae bacterium]|nr:hypothetical protein [Methylophilaceae bacterium]|tara:strand:+ start:45 stop:206 length:162 start_codon:yes stop_codon:yes gene_type:complete
MDIIQLAITTFGVLCLILAINFFEKNDKKRGCIYGIIGLILVIFAGNVAILFT